VCKNQTSVRHSYTLVHWYLIKHALLLQVVTFACHSATHPHMIPLSCTVLHATETFLVSVGKKKGSGQTHIATLCNVV